MPSALKKLSSNCFLLSLFAGISVFLAFEPFNLPFTLLAFPWFVSQLLAQVRNARAAFLYGFFLSFIVMLGGFYWVTYVIHEFGYLPWSVSGLLFLGFCGFGALNFPVFLWAAYQCQNVWLKASQIKKSPLLWGLFFLPALFTLTEWVVPKLFPWYLGHCLYWLPALIQISDFTGSTLLTFAIYTLGSAMALAVNGNRRALLLPSLLWVAILSYGVFSLQKTYPTRPLKVALIQANIGSLEKVQAEKGLGNKVRYVVDRYRALTESAVKTEPKLDLILWPETALPFALDSVGPWPEEVRNFVREKNIPLITGGYSAVPQSPYRDYNAGFLLEPTPGGIRTQLYRKNILLAFGEYFPLGETFPSLYQWFPQVSDFARGKEPGVFRLGDNRLGITICYEAIVPSFVRRTAQTGVHALINLTNDSWFGPTSEPYLHAALTVFRAVEHRVPFARVTNTGTSFTVDSFGRRSKLTPVYQEATLVSELPIRAEIGTTFYQVFGDWFIGLIFLAALATALLFRREDASVSR